MNTIRSEDAERTRLSETREDKAPWKKWGPYLSERQWGTVRAAGACRSGSVVAKKAQAYE